MNKQYKLIVHVPVTDADNVRQAIGDAGGGMLGHYTHCSFSYTGTGRFKPTAEANPHIGQAGQYEEVQEESIEVSPISPDKIKQVIDAMRAVHPYEEPGFELFELVDVDNL